MWRLIMVYSVCKGKHKLLLQAKGFEEGEASVCCDFHNPEFPDDNAVFHELLKNINDVKKLV